jgi:hypothetical protein
MLSSNSYLWAHDTKTRQQLMALGEFVLVYAETENQLLETLRVVGKVSKPFARATLSGVRTDQAIQYIDRFFEVVPPKPAVQALYDEIFPRLRNISTARNLILHYGISDEGIATDKSRALTAKRSRSIPMSAEILAHMINDLLKIHAALTINLLQIQKRAVVPSDLWNVVRRRAWLYTPQQPSQPKSSKGRKDRD